MKSKKQIIIYEFITGNNKTEVGDNPMNEQSANPSFSNS